MTSDPLFWLLAILAVAALGLAKGGFAGLGMISTPLMALVMPPLEAAAVLLPILLLQDGISMWVFRKEWDAWNFKMLVAGGVIGVGAAWLLAARVTDAQITLAVGVISLIFALNHWFGPKPSEIAVRPRASVGVLCGGLAGFTSALIQVGAPPYFVFVLPQRLPKMVLVGTTAWFFGAINVMKIAPYVGLGQFSTAGLWTSVALVPLAVAANFVGIWLVRRMPQELFYKFAYIMMFLISLELIRRGGLTVLRG